MGEESENVKLHGSQHSHIASKPVVCFVFGSTEENLESKSLKRFFHCLVYMAPLLVHVPYSSLSCCSGSLFTYLSLKGARKGHNQLKIIRYKIMCDQIKNIHTLK